MAAICFLDSVPTYFSLDRGPTRYSPSLILSGIFPFFRLRPKVAACSYINLSFACLVRSVYSLSNIVFLSGYMVSGIILDYKAVHLLLDNRSAY